MKTNLSPVLKLIAVAFMLLQSTSSFSQHNFANYGHGSSNYYPRQHDSEVTVKPALIKQNFLYYGFLSTLNQHISIEYNRQMSDEIMLMGQVGIINSGLSQVTSGSTYQGGYFEGGVKLFLNPDYTRVGRHKYYCVEGFYFKPEFVLSIFNTISTTTYSYYVYPPSVTTNNYSYTGGAIILNIGGQWIIAHSFDIDLYVGAGVSFSNAYSANEPIIYDYFSYLTTGSNVPVAFTGGINIGLPF